MPTKKGKSKPAKLKKASNKIRRSPKRGVEGRPAATRRVTTGRVTATGSSARKVTPEGPGSGSGAGATARKAPPAPEGSPDRKATGEGTAEGRDRVRIL